MRLSCRPDRIPLLMHNILTKRFTFRGFIVGDFAAQLPQFLSICFVTIHAGRQIE
jgi:hypothetical protein